MNTELYLCERDAGINVPDQRYIDLAYYADVPVCNQQLDLMWRRCLTIWPAWLLEPVLYLNRFFPGGLVHEVGNNTNHDRDVNNLLEETLPHLRFSAQEEADGRSSLEKLGVPAGAKFICLHARDSAYLETIVNPGGDFSYHDYRDVDVDNFVLAANALADLGYYVIRMGKVVKAPIKSSNPKVIDYASSELRNDFLDIYFGANCFFCIAVGSGFDSIPAMFRRPICFVNVVPIGCLHTFLKDSIAICKKHWLVPERRWLSLREIANYGLDSCLYSIGYQEKHVELKENTPHEIRELTLEMVARLTDEWEVTPEDDSLQRRFWEIYPVKRRRIDSGSPMHGKVNLRYGSKFLRDNQAWLK